MNFPWFFHDLVQEDSHGPHDLLCLKRDACPIELSKPTTLGC